MSAAFYTSNRTKLQKSSESELIIIKGNDLVQASSDTTYPFYQDGYFFYLTGLNEPGLTLILDAGDTYLIAPDYDPVRAAFDGAVDHGVLSNISGITEIVSQTEGWKRLCGRLKTSKGVGLLEPSDVYIDSHQMFTQPTRHYLKKNLLTQNQQLSFEDLRPVLAGMRIIKTNYEVEQVEAAIGATGRLLEVIESVRMTATNEKDIMAAVAAERVKLDLPYAYEPIIAAGSNAVTLHYIRNNAALKKDDLLLLDIGLKYGGYSADITRTVTTRPNKRQQQVFDVVLRVQEYAYSLLRPGITFKDYEQQVRQFMGEQLQILGLIKEVTPELIRQYYPHSTSHFLGIDVHDVGDYAQPLAEGMVITVEPGIYIAEEGIGIRIEDDVLITKNGYRDLSKDLPKSISSLTIGVA